MWLAAIFGVQRQMQPVSSVAESFQNKQYFSSEINFWNPWSASTYQSFISVLLQLPLAYTEVERQLKTETIISHLRIIHAKPTATRVIQIFSKSVSSKPKNPYKKRKHNTYSQCIVPPGIASFRVAPRLSQPVRTRLRAHVPLSTVFAITDEVARLKRGTTAKP